MKKLFLLACLAVAVHMLASCTTADVQHTCAEAQDLLGIAGPLEGVAPAEVRVALALLRTGAVVCGSPQYSAARDKVAAWLHTRMQR